MLQVRAELGLTCGVPRTCSNEITDQAVVLVVLVVPVDAEAVVVVVVGAMIVHATKSRNRKVPLLTNAW